MSTSSSEWSGRIASACAEAEASRQRLLVTARRMLEESLHRTNGHGHAAPVVHLPALGTQDDLPVQAAAASAR